MNNNDFEPAGSTDEVKPTDFFKHDMSISESRDKDYELKVVALENITLGKRLGGNWGISGVFQAEVKNLFAVGKKSIVAIKKLEEGHTDKDLSDLFNEMTVMKNIGRHENILDLLGCCSANGELIIIVEWPLNGYLKDYLERLRNLNDRGEIVKRNLKKLRELLMMLLHFSWQIARGMEYLASKRCVHRDLAARNVLVDLSHTIKICDFGEARVIEANGYFQQTDDKPVPFRWLAPESLVDRKYDTRSDVWSYGILLWEIFTLGSQPYPWVEGFKILTILRDGYRLERPENCPLPIYKIMKDCWKYLPADRPTFADLVQNFADVMTPEGLDSLIESDVTLSASSLT